MRQKLSIAALIAVAIFTGCKNNTKTANNSNAAPTKTVASAPQENANVTGANFAKIQTGMTYEDVVKILGLQGKAISENEVPGLKTVMYQWDGQGFYGVSNMKVVFQNNKVVDKANAGVK